MFRDYRSLLGLSPTDRYPAPGLSQQLSSLSPFFFLFFHQCFTFPYPVHMITPNQRNSRKKKNNLEPHLRSIELSFSPTPASSLDYCPPQKSLDIDTMHTFLPLNLFPGLVKPCKTEQPSPQISTLYITRSKTKISNRQVTPVHTV